MNTRIGALTAATALAVATGCSSPPSALGKHLIQISVNGNDAGNFPVECHQTGWLWEIRTLEETPGVVAHVNTEGAPVTARGVQIDNVGGFTGSYWEGTTGDAEADLTNGTFTVTGTAEGFFHDKPGERTTASFELTTGC